MLQITSYVIAERKSPNWPFLLLILLPKTTLILWYKSYHKTFPKLIIVDVTPYFICNCWTQVTKLVTSTAYFVAKNFSTHYSPQNGQKKVVKLASLATYLVANFFFFFKLIMPTKMVAAWNPDICTYPVFLSMYWVCNKMGNSPAKLSPYTAAHMMYKVT